MSLAESEYAVLRHTIASRGTARITLLPVTLIGWALVAGTLALLGNNPGMSLFSLAVLAGGFEAIHAMHVGVERIGRYLRFSMKDRPTFRDGRQQRWPSARLCLAAESTHSSA